MFAEKPTFPTSKLRLPPIGQSRGHPLQSPPTPSSLTTDISNVHHPADNLTELKNKYTDYTAWLKASTGQTRGPIVSRTLLKNSLCQMGIDLAKAEQLVSTCSWYVYQFQKDLKIDPKEKDQSTTVESKKTSSHTTRSKRMPRRKCHGDDSSSTITSSDKDEFEPVIPARRHHFVLPAIEVSDLSTSSRYRHVDFHAEQSSTPTSNPQSAHWRSALVKTRVLNKLQPISRKSSISHTPLENHLSPSHRGLLANQTRSILRKQTSSSSSTRSTDINSRKVGSGLLTPSSTITDDVPLGTRSRRLFGGSHCFAQIMNELEQQTDY